MYYCCKRWKNRISTVTDFCCLITDVHNGYLKLRNLKDQVESNWILTDSVKIAIGSINLYICAIQGYWSPSILEILEQRILHPCLEGRVENMEQ